MFYGNEDETGIHNVDVMTDVSAPATAFTRYTVAPTSASRTSRYVFAVLAMMALTPQILALEIRRTSRSKRKMERKVGSGRKGTVDEEEYLLKSVTKLVDKFLMTQGQSYISRGFE